MTDPSPDSHPHTDPDAELPETVAVHIEWLRRPRSVSDNTDAYRADNHQSADYLSRLLAVAHRLAERAEQAVADRDRLAARVETLEGAGRDVIEWWDDDERGGTTEVDALRALVAPDTPTSRLDPRACTMDGPASPPPCGEVCDTCPLPMPSRLDTGDTVDRHEAYAMDAEGHGVPVSGGEPQPATSGDNGPGPEDKVVDLMAALEDSVAKAKAARRAVREAREASEAPVVGEGNDAR